MSLQDHEANGAAGDAGSSAVDKGVLERALLQLATRIETVLLEEQTALASQPNDLDLLVARKEHLALQISCLSRARHGGVPDASVRERLEMTSRRLLENSRLLRRHIDAVGEIAALVAGIVHKANDDGTYSRYAARQDRSS